MRRVAEILPPFALLGSMSLARPIQGMPGFEAAAVHASSAGTTESRGFLPGGRLEFRGTTLLGLITLAYNVQSERVTGGPSGLDTDRFDVTAKASPSASPAVLRTILPIFSAGRLQERSTVAAQN